MESSAKKSMRGHQEVHRGSHHQDKFGSSQFGEGEDLSQQAQHDSRTGMLSSLFNLALPIYSILF